MKTFNIFLAFIGLVFCISCTKFEDVGSDLVSDGQFTIVTDTSLSVSYQNVERDSFLAFQIDSGTFTPTQHMVALFDDPIFGNTKYVMNSQLELALTSYNFEGAEFDSAFFYLAYDTTFTPYGNYNQTQTIDIYEIDSDLPNTIYTSDQHPYKNELLGSLTFIPAPNTYIEIDSTTSLDPHIKIPLNSTFGEKILSLDSATTSNVIDFTDAFNGLAIVPREGSFDGAIKFDISYSISGINIYYRQDDTTKLATMQFSNRVPHFNTVSHDLTGSIAEDIITNDVDNPEYLLLQPGNLGVKMTFDDLSTLQGKIINNAELVWEIAGHPQDDTATYDMPFDVFMTTNDNFGSRTYISDITNYLSDSQYRLFFVGLFQENTENTGAKLSYYMNITDQMQRIVDGIDENQLFIVNTPQDVNRIRRSVIYGPGISDAKLRPKIKISYSTIN
ncbi:DUF4270 domain-containing protein [Membranihabitans marinus]|uniref:DUF4270 domain-containing protein n=1 Tax=Membranihabitans marinus TaxID=1227546 RepID=UPI001F45AB30|nr:DUF4270 domain-containing protein [Membranihabitans marinus]